MSQPVSWNDVWVHTAFVEECFGVRVRYTVVPQGIGKPDVRPSWLVYCDSHQFRTDHRPPCGASSFGGNSGLAAASSAFMVALIHMYEALDDRLKEAAAKAGA